MIHSCNASYIEGGHRRIVAQGWPLEKCEILSEKQCKSKRDGGMAQEVEYLPGKWDVLSSIPSTTKKKKKATLPQ
jgi:hypothetical protein